MTVWMGIRTAMLLNAFLTVNSEVDMAVCDSDDCDEFAMIQVSLKGKQRMKRRATDPVCVAVKAAAAAYRFGAIGGFMAADSAADALRDMGWDFLRSFNKSVDGDFDNLGWWAKRDSPSEKGECLFVFQGSDANADFANNFAKAEITYKGVEGIHQGIANEIDPLISQIEWDKVHNKCLEGITVVGHSLGGGLAQLFALLLTQEGDPLQAGVTLKNLFAFGGMSLGAENWPNQQSSDGCFPGDLYWNARKNAEGNIEVDIVTGAATGGQELEPVKSDKHLLFEPNSDGTVNSLDFECGNLVPKKYGGSGPDLHGIAMYEYYVGCIDAEEYNRVAVAH